MEHVYRLAQTVVSPSTGAVTHPVLWVVDLPKQARQWLRRAGRVQRQSKVSVLTTCWGKFIYNKFISKSSASLLLETWSCSLLRLPSAPCESSGQRCETASMREQQCDASCSSDVGSPPVSSSAGRSFQGGSRASAATEITEPEATEETSGGCRRSEPTEQAAGGDKRQPARGTQDSDDSDDDPILIPPSRFRGQGQRYSHPLYPSLTWRFCYIFKPFLSYL